MMATTHALVGFVLGAVATALGVPGPLAVGVAVAGSVAPDLDLYRGHRRTLHYPILFPVAAVLTGALAALSSGFAVLPGAVAAFPGGLAGISDAALAFALATLFLAAAAVHVALDVLGGGLELRPWEGTSERAVYDHVRGRWIAPRRWIPYDGSPEDLAVAGALTAVAAPFYDGVWIACMVALVAISFAYVLLRRRLAALAPAVATRLPDPVRERVPGRYLE